MENSISRPDGVVIRPYTAADRPALREFAANDEFARPKLFQRQPRYGQYLADGLAHFYDLEPESTFVAEHRGDFIGNVLGTTDAKRADRLEETYTKRLRLKRGLLGHYGLPTWMVGLREVLSDHKPYPHNTRECDWAA